MTMDWMDRWVAYMVIYMEIKWLTEVVVWNGVKMEKSCLCDMVKHQ